MMNFVEKNAYNDAQPIFDSILCRIIFVWLFSEMFDKSVEFLLFQSMFSKLHTYHKSMSNKLQNNESAADKFMIQYKYD